MRSLIIAAAAVVALAAVALAGLAQTLAQLGAIEPPSPPIALATGNEPPAHAANEEEPAGAASSGDEHIMRALAENPDFMRAAEELLQDPDPQTQQEARQLLRELGALDER